MKTLGALNINCAFPILKLKTKRETPENLKDTKGKNIILRIGNADKEITGKQTYVIKYSVQKKGGGRFFQDYAEFYWSPMP